MAVLGASWAAGLLMGVNAILAGFTLYWQPKRNCSWEAGLLQPEASPPLASRGGWSIRGCAWPGRVPSQKQLWNGRTSKRTEWIGDGKPAQSYGTGFRWRKVNRPILL